MLGSTSSQLLRFVAGCTASGIIRKKRIASCRLHADRPLEKTEISCFFPFNEPLINSSLNCQRTKNKKCDFCFSRRINLLIAIDSGGT